MMFLDMVKVFILKRDLKVFVAHIGFVLVPSQRIISESTIGNGSFIFIW